VKVFVFWPVLLVVVLLDVITKAIAVAALYPPGYVTRAVIGDAVRFTLVYNPGAAFGLHLGTYSRWIFMALTLGALIILWRLYRQTLMDDLRRASAIALVAAGAIGNLIDRVRSENGVVDFIDIGMGVHRWPTFNIADMAVSCGAFLLAFVLWGEEQALQSSTAEASAAGTDPIIVKRPDATEIS
jgi:signal peptidase II